MFGLEYLLLFGLPENQIENLHEGRTRVGLALATREQAQAQYLHWVEELAAWGCEGFLLQWEDCRIDLLVPLNWEVSFNSRILECRREVWSERSGWEPALRRDTVVGNGTRIFGDALVSTPLLLSAESMVSPLAFLGGREGPPELVWEELNSANEAQLRGAKRGLYFEAGVGELWYFQAESERVEVLRSGSSGFESVGWFGKGDFLVYGRRNVAVSALLEGAVAAGEAEFCAEPEARVGLQQVLLAGLPWLRFEYWDGWCRRFLPCRSLEQAVRVGEWLRMEIERWDASRFRLHQRGQVLEVAVRVDARLHREFLEFCGRGDVGG